MTPAQAKQLIIELSQKINRYNDEYYQHGESSIDDNTYDIFLNQLIELENQFPEFLDANSPSQRVGGEPIEQFKNVRHNHPMLSLSNLYSQDDLEDWISSLQSRLSTKNVVTVCETKIDGVAISVVYENGVLKQAVTRGNGEIGDDVTNNVKTIHTLPLKLDKSVSLELRGEIYLSRHRFDILNRNKEDEGISAFKNPRNAAAGTVRMKDPKEVAQRGLDILLYDLVAGQISDKHSENLNYIDSLGLPVNPHRRVCVSTAEVFEFCNDWEKNKEELPFDIDGVVIKLEHLNEREILGMTAKSPRWATAWKFKAEKATSRLINIENSIGRTGILTPVANLEPVKLLGTEVKRATLHNYDQIARLGIHHEDVLFIEKGGDIIPKIVGVDYTQRKPDSTAVIAPTYCPVCNTNLVKMSEEIDLRCDNPFCPAVIEGMLEHFISKKGMNIQSLGSAIIHQLIQLKFVANIADIYQLKDIRANLIKLEGMGEKSVDNLLEAIEESKTVPMNQFIFALGIRHIGEKAAKTIAVELSSPEDLLALTEDKLSKLPDFGPVMIESFLNWTQNEKNEKIIKKIIELGVTPKPLERQLYQPFANQSVVITGTLSKPRDQWKVQLEKAGFKIISSISKKTNYLLAGENAGSKLEKAKKNNIKILTEAEMIHMLAEEQS